MKNIFDIIKIALGFIILLSTSPLLIVQSIVNRIIIDAYKLASKLLQSTIRNK